ncbi:hypothetical protein H0H81_002442 [Sphagnurus paluster]|uniref:Uncharacterized protein n=1 Tax=Sphagnurus paluster TaxID=117069 RepID=A0A9P7GTX9_9AGAR|nr:hypothetical protein H0H81_002442 [Sphagnurus paluster]
MCVIPLPEASTTDPNFPSPSLSLSPLTAAPPDSPAMDLSADSSTVEYATAGVSSAWGTDISVHPGYLGSGRLPNTTLNARLDTQTGEPDLTPSNRPLVSTSVVHTMKKLGNKMKMFLARRAHRKGAKPVTEETHNEQFEAPESLAERTNVFSQVDVPQPRDDSLVSMEEFLALPVPLPPGLVSTLGTRKRSGLTSGTFASTPNSLHPSNGSDLSPRIRITPSSSLSQSHPGPNQSIEDNHTSQNNTSALEIQARPKTLAEIKSKRRLSLSTLSYTSRFASQPSSSVVAVAHTRARPRPSSTIVFTTASSSSLADNDLNDADGNRSDSVANRSPNHEETPRQIPAMRASFYGSLAARTSTPNPRVTANIKKKRRFSLSALSSLVNTIRSEMTTSGNAF